MVEACFACMPTVRGESNLPTNNGDRCPRMVAIVVRNCCPRMVTSDGNWSFEPGPFPYVWYSSHLKHGMVYTRMISTNLHIHFGSSTFVGNPRSNNHSRFAILLRTAKFQTSVLKLEILQIDIYRSLSGSEYRCS